MWAFREETRRDRDRARPTPATGDIDLARGGAVRKAARAAPGDLANNLATPVWSEARQWVAKELRANTQGEEILRLSRWTRTEFVGERQRRGLFEPKTYRETIGAAP